MLVDPSHSLVREPLPLMAIPVNMFPATVRGLPTESIAGSRLYVLFG